MPRRKSSIKRKRADKTRHLKNIRVKQKIKKVVKKFQGLLSAKNIEDAKKILSEVYSQLDKAAKKKIIHPRTASRRKSRFAHTMLRTGK